MSLIMGRFVNILYDMGTEDSIDEQEIDTIYTTIYT